MKRKGKGAVTAREVIAGVRLKGVGFAGLHPGAKAES